MSAPGEKYRPDVDGLRAVAVLAVLAFHASPNRVPGGFVGVDVFFVISGFLITGILLSDIDAGRFSILQFYVRRARRLFPALALVLLTCLVLGLLMLLPRDSAAVGRHIVAGAAFVSNLLLFSEVDYFDADPGSKPLLHLWSLGVEEQFYLFWPLLLYFVRGTRRGILLAIGLIGTASFIANIVLTNRAPDAAFYLPVSRFWELMLGSLLAVISRASATTRSAALSAARVRDVASVLGAVLVLASIAFLKPTMRFPGWWAVPVVFGTTLLIWAGPTAWLNRTLLSSRPLVYVGLISYPLYLWHWPLLSFGWVAYAEQPPLIVRVGLIALSFVLAWLTYRFIETPVRRHRPPRDAVQLAGVLAASVGVLGVLGLLTAVRVILPVSATNPELVAIGEALGDNTPTEHPRIRGTDDAVAVLIGDSHMAQYRPRIELLGSNPPLHMPTVESYTGGGCIPIPGLTRASRSYCSSMMSAGFARALDPKVHTVVIGAAWVQLDERSDYFRVDVAGDEPHALSAAEKSTLLEQSLGAYLAHLRQQGKRVFVFLSSPGGELFDPLRMVDRTGIIPRAHYRATVSREEANLRTKAIDEIVRTAATEAGATIVDPSDWVCSISTCPTVEDGRPLTSDGWHLRPAFVRSKFTALDGIIIPNLTSQNRSN